MFELIFKAPYTLRRHREGPLADERARYLTQLAEGGVSRSTLQHAAISLLRLVARIDLTGDQKVSAEQIEKVADDWAHCKKALEIRSSAPYGSRERFRAVARAWPERHQPDNASRLALITLVSPGAGTGSFSPTLPPNICSAAAT